MTDLWLPQATEEEIRRERAKARELKRTPWWQRRCATGLCYHCGKKYPPRELTMDHLVPLIRGGRSNKGNLVPSCKDCNSAKKHGLVFEAELEAARHPKD